MIFIFKFLNHRSVWRILRCNSCAGSAIHVKCVNSADLSNGSIARNWLCHICREVERRLQDEDKENGFPNTPSATPPDSEDGNKDETPANTGVANFRNDDDVSSIFSASSDESLFTTTIVKRKIPNTTRQTDEEEISGNDNSSVSSDESLFTPIFVNRKIPNTTRPTNEEEIPENDSDNSSVSSGGSLFSVVKKQPSDHNSRNEMHPSLPLSGIKEPTVEMVTIQDMKIDEDTDSDRSQSPIPVLSLPGSDFDDDSRSDFSANGTNSGSSSEISLFIPVEPLRKRMRVTDTEEVTIPPFKIYNLDSDDDNFKEIRCYCGKYDDEEPLTECRRCGISFHLRCQAGLFKKYGKSLKTRCCQRCTGSQALKELQEIPIAGKHVPKGCESSRSRTYYLTLVHRGEIMVRRHDAVYISEEDNEDVESRRILRVDKLWKNRR